MLHDHVDPHHYPSTQCQASGCTNSLDAQQVANGERCCSQECNTERLMSNHSSRKRNVRVEE